MYLYKFQNVFVQNSKSMCLKFKSLVQEVFAKHCNPDDKETGGAHRYLSKCHKVFVQISKCICPNFKMYLPNTVIPMIKRLVGLAGLLSSLSLLLPTAESFMNCSVLLSTNIFSSSTMVMMILMISRLAPKRYPPKIYPPKMCLPKLNLAQLPALMKCNLSKYTHDNCALRLGLGDTSQNR